MSHDPVSANGEAMPAADATFITPHAGAVALACVALHRHRVALDALRHQAELEVVEYARARLDMEALIDRLIQGLDDADAPTIDLEPWLAGSNPADEDREGDHGEDADFEPDLQHEPTLGWTEREARTGRYGRNAQDDDEPSMGALERHPSPWGNGYTPDGAHVFWAGSPTPLHLDECEEENEHGDMSDEEPSLGAPEVQTGFGSSNKFGSARLNGFDQTLWASGTGQDIELDDAEHGIADHGALYLLEQELATTKAARFDGSGVTIACAQLAQVWKAARRDPDQVYVIEPGVAAMFARRPTLCRVGNMWLPA